MKFMHTSIESKALLSGTIVGSQLAHAGCIDISPQHDAKCSNSLKRRLKHRSYRKRSGESLHSVNSEMYHLLCAYEAIYTASGLQGVACAFFDSRASQEFILEEMRIMRMM